MSTEMGKLIKKRREELGLTQEELAHKLGYKSKSTINKIELGINDINQSKIIAFSKVLNVPVRYLMGWEDSEDDKTNINIPDIETILETNNKKYLLRFISTFAKLQRVNNDMTEKQVSSQIGLDLDDYIRFEDCDIIVDNSVILKVLDQKMLVMSYVKGFLTGLNFVLSAIDNEDLDDIECDIKKNKLIDKAIVKVKEAIIHFKEK